MDLRLAPELDTTPAPIPNPPEVHLRDVRVQSCLMCALPWIVSVVFVVRDVTVHSCVSHLLFRGATALIKALVYVGDE